MTPLKLICYFHLQAQNQSIVQVNRIPGLHRLHKHRCDEWQPPTSANYGAASLVWWPNSEAQKHLKQTNRQPGTLKPNSVNAVSLKNGPVPDPSMIWDRSVSLRTGPAKNGPVLPESHHICPICEKGYQTDYQSARAFECTPGYKTAWMHILWYQVYKKRVS